jgi:hypothetical protein
MDNKSGTNKPDDDRPRVDLALVLLVLFGLAVLVYLTFDLWPRHP